MSPSLPCVTVILFDVTVADCFPFSPKTSTEVPAGVADSVADLLLSRVKVSIFIVLPAAFIMSAPICLANKSKLKVGISVVIVISLEEDKVAKTALPLPPCTVVEEVVHSIPQLVSVSEIIISFVFLSTSIMSYMSTKK